MKLRYQCFRYYHRIEGDVRMSQFSFESCFFLLFDGQGSCFKRCETARPCGKLDYLNNYVFYRSFVIDVSLRGVYVCFFLLELKSCLLSTN